MEQVENLLRGLLKLQKNILSQLDVLQFENADRAVGSLKTVVQMIAALREEECSTGDPQELAAQTVDRLVHIMSSDEEMGPVLRKKRDWVLDQLAATPTSKAKTAKSK